MYHGKECPHCHVMMPLVDQLVEETGVEIEKKEVCHDEANAEQMRSHQDVIKPACGGELGTPAFIKTSGKDALCGEVSYDELKVWATQ